MYRVQISMDIQTWMVPNNLERSEPITSFMVDTLEEVEEIKAQLEVEVEDTLKSLRKDYDS